MEALWTNTGGDIGRSIFMAGSPVKFPAKNAEILGAWPTPFDGDCLQLTHD